MVGAYTMALEEGSHIVALRSCTYRGILTIAHMSCHLKSFKRHSARCMFKDPSMLLEAALQEGERTWNPSAAGGSIRRSSLESI